MEQLWRRIESWLEARAPELLERLLPGASEADLARFEQQLGRRIPEDVRRSLAIHGGQPAGSYGALGDWALLRPDDSVERWRTLTQLLDAGELVDPLPDQVRGAMARVWWSASWIPIASDSAGSLLCADTAPPPAGVPGQIVLFLHNEPWREVVAESFAALLARFADDLEAGHYRAERGYGAAWLVDRRGE